MNDISKELIKQCRRDMTNLGNWYTWPVKRNLLPAGIRLPAIGCSSYDENVALKHSLYEAYKQGDDKRKIELTRYYIVQWGGIGANRPKRIEEYATNSVDEILALGTRGIASWSKALCIRNPEKWLIFDARVSAALNSIQFLGKVHDPILFPKLSPRNNYITGNIVKLISYGRNSGWKRSRNATVYLDYINIVTTVAKELDQKSYTIEMWLFSEAERLLSEATSQLTQE